MAPMRRTHSAAAIARVLLAEPGGRHYGWELRKGSGQRSATVYRVLARFMDQGWLTDGWEDPNEVLGRPPRRYYLVTEAGRTGLSELVNRPTVSEVA